MNNKGQTLVIFVVILPILIIVFAAIVNVGYMNTEKNRLDDINRQALSYGLDNIKKDDIKVKIENLIKENDANINILKISITDKQIVINLEKQTKNVFRQIIGLDKTKIKSKYIGKIKKNKKEIKKG